MTTKAFRRKIACAALVALLAPNGGAALAKNFTFPFMSSKSMQSFCSFNNGYFTSSADGSAYTCVKPNGDNYTCVKPKTCAGTTYGSTPSIQPESMPEPHNLAATFSSSAPTRFKEN